MKLFHAEGFCAVSSNPTGDDEVVGFAIVQSDMTKEFMVVRLETPDRNDSQLNHVLSGSQPGDDVDVSQWTEFTDRFLAIEAAKKFMGRQIQQWQTIRSWNTISRLGWRPSALDPKAAMAELRPKDRFDDDERRFVERMRAKKREAQSAAADAVSDMIIGEEARHAAAWETTQRNKAVTPKGCPERRTSTEIMLWQATPTKHGGKYWAVDARPLPGPTPGTGQWEVVSRWGAFGSTGNDNQISVWPNQTRALEEARRVAANKLKQGYREA